MTRPFTVPDQTFVRLVFHDGFVEGEDTKGYYHIEGLGFFDFEVARFKVPSSDPSGGTEISVFYQDGSLLCDFKKGKLEHPGDPQETFFFKTLLVALAAEAGCIQGVEPGSPVEFPLDVDLKCVSDMR